MITSESKPQFFWDPVAAATHPHEPGTGKLVVGAGESVAPPAPPKNPARLADAIIERFETMPGWADFVTACSILSALSSSPGWEDSSSPPKPTQPGATPIGLAQWGAAISTAGLLASEVAGAGWAHPGIDPKGFIWLNYRVGESEFSLELHAGAIQQSYKWTRIVDGNPASHAASSAHDVIEALRDFLRTTKRAA